MRASFSLEELVVMVLALRPDVAKRLAGRRRSCRDLEDKTQETMMRALGSLPTYDPSKGDLRGWVYGIADNVKRNAYRKEKRQERHFWPELNDAERSPSPDASPEETLHWKTAAYRVLSAVEDMPEPILSVFVLYDCEGSTHAGIGETLGIPPGSSKSRLHLARVHIRDRIGRVEDELWAALPPGFLAFLREEPDVSPTALETESTPPPSIGARIYEASRIGANACAALLIALFLLPLDRPDARTGLDRGIAQSAELRLLRSGVLDSQVYRVEGPLPAPTKAEPPPSQGGVSSTARNRVELLLKKKPTFRPDTLLDSSPVR